MFKDNKIVVRCGKKDSWIQGIVSGNWLCPTVQARQWVAELKMFKFSLAVIGAKEIRNEYTTGAA